MVRLFSTTIEQINLRLSKFKNGFEHSFCMFCLLYSVVLANHSTFVKLFSVVKTINLQYILIMKHHRSLTPNNRFGNRHFSRTNSAQALRILIVARASSSIVCFQTSQ